MPEQPYKMEGPMDIPVDRLLFWPNNPRLKISDFKELEYTHKQLVDPENQSKIYKLLQDNEHSVDTLIKSMSQSGFMREKALIALKIEGKNKYLILEGNRRLTAIRTINEKNGTKFDKIPCWLFVHVSKTIPLKSAINRLVAEHHIKGQKPHTKIQQAQMLYNTYMGFLEETGLKTFFLAPNIVKQSAGFFGGFTEEEFTLELSVARLYNQMIETGYEVDHKKCRERLTWVHKNPKHFTRTFGYNVKSLQLSSTGLEKYHEIFIAEGCAVHNPPLFKRFLNVLRYGDTSHIELIRHQPDRLKSIEQEILDAKEGQRFVLDLGRIQRKLSGLKPGEYKKTSEENKLIGQIIRLVDGKLKKLRDGQRISTPNESRLEPTTTNAKDETTRVETVRSYSELTISALVKCSDLPALNEIKKRIMDKTTKGEPVSHDLLQAE
ncbi:MAG: ParB N-terminal domain-containing protein, partial [Opitutae bacterium]|nr:ParB N-terminal domain-containing protein [Opitutae bacterium]